MTTDERIAGLEATIDDLRAEVKRLARRESMDRTLTCPACGGGKIIGVKQIFDETSHSLIPLRLIRHADPENAHAAILQAYVCTNCCLVEWRVHSPEGLIPDGKNVLEFDRGAEAPPKDATYR